MTLCREPLVEQVARRLRTSVATAQLRAGDYLASERVLCRELGVSRFTIRAALCALLREGLIERHPSRGYRVLGAPGPATPGDADTAVIFLHGLAEADVVGDYHGRIWAGARLEAERLGTRLLISSVNAESPTARKAQDLRALARLVICDKPDESWVDALLAAGLRVVLVDQVYLGRHAGELDAVVQDDTAGVRLALEHLAARGHRRIGYLDFSELLVPQRRGNATRRLGAFLGEGRRLGLDDDPALAATPRSQPEADSPGPAEALIAAGATALLAPARRVLGGAREALRRRQIPLHGDFGFVAWGDPLPGGEEREFPTSITWSKEQMGREAVRRLLSGASQPDALPVTIEIPTRLVDRDTSGWHASAGRAHRPAAATETVAKRRKAPAT